MRKFLPALLLIIVSVFLKPGTANAQDAPIFSQFFLNPFQFNPSYCAHNGYAEANIFYRKQWLGIENAPSIGAFNVQAPVGRHVSLGFSGYSNKTILLSTNAALATFGYRVNLGPNHHLNFGLSGGISINNFDLAAVANLNDPALKDVIQKSTFANAQFGVNYQFRNFNIGFSLPKMLNSKPNSLESFEKIKFDAFKSKFVSVSYNFQFADIEVSPIFLFRSLDNPAVQSQWEAMVVATYRKMLWVGASYRDGYGITGFLGIGLNSFRVGYAYEHPTASITSAAGGSHEIYLGTRIGKRNRDEEYLSEKNNKDSLKEAEASRKARTDSLKAQKPVVKEPEVKPKEPEIVTKEPEVIPKEVPPVVTEKEPAIITPPPVEEKKPVIEEKKPVVEEPPKKAEMEGYFVVFGAYRNPENAMHMMANMKIEGLKPQMIYGAKKQYYYVYTFQSMNRKECVAELARVKSKFRFRGMWIMDAKKDK